MDYESLQQELALKAPLWKKVSPTESHQDCSTTVVYRMDKASEWNSKKKRRRPTCPPHPHLIWSLSLPLNNTIVPHSQIFIYKLCRRLYIACEAVTVWTDWEAAFVFICNDRGDWLVVYLALNSKWTHNVRLLVALVSVGSPYTLYRSILVFFD